MERRALRGGPILTRALLFAFLAALGSCICFYYASLERVFYWWDHGNYQKLTQAATQAFGQSFVTGVRHVHDTLSEDYNSLFTLPLIPFAWAFGLGRGAFLSAIHLVYHVPLFWVVGLLLSRLFPERREVAIVVGALAAFVSPDYWRTLLAGYPDSGGALLIAAAGLLYIDRTTGKRPWRRAVFIGLALGASCVFRRHFAYAMVSFLAAVSLDAVLDRFLSSRFDRASLGAFGRRCLHVMVSAAVVLVIVLVVIPEPVQHAWQYSRTGQAPWQLSRSEAARTILNVAGAVPILLAVLGLGLVWWRTPSARPAVRFILLLTGSWFVVCIFAVRQAAHHFPHVVPLTISLGLGALILVACEEVGVYRRALMVGGVSALSGLSLLQAMSSSAKLDWAHRLPIGVLPFGFPPLESPAFDDVVSLLRYLRAKGSPGARVIVAASSSDLNFDLLSSAQTSVYADERIQFVATSQVDAEGMLPTPALVSADLVVAATPILYHLDPNEQKVVKVLVDVFDERWPVSEDFNPVPEVFDLHTDTGVAKVRVFLRRRPTTEDVVYETAKRMFERVLGTATGQRQWYQVSGEFPGRSAVKPDGATEVIGHPSHTEAPPTIFRTTAVEASAAVLAGTVMFMDARCKGAQLIVLHDALGKEQTVIGAFVPGAAAQGFRQTLPAGDRDVRLLIRSSLQHPTDIDFCTVHIDDLRLSAASP